MRLLLACLLLVTAVAVHAANGDAPAASTAPAASAAAGATAAPATWHAYGLLIDLQNLPKTYSCDDLWYKFRDLLLELGARPYMTITPFHCGAPRRGEERSPSVELKFQLPEPLHGTATRYASISAVTRTLHVEPGSPRSFGAGDCELVRQLQGTLFAALPVHVTAARFSCTPARAEAARSYALTLEAAIAKPLVSAAQAPAATAGAPGS
jgi:hypothetical protein